MKKDRKTPNAVSKTAKNTPNKTCMVPKCEAKWCDATRKKTCALRRYFLLEQIENRKLLRMTYTPEMRKIVWERIYGKKKS